MTKEDLMKELLDRYVQYSYMDENNSAKVLLEMYIKELEFRLVRLLEK